jgi:Tol biopolymer transport system component
MSLAVLAAVALGGLATDAASSSLPASAGLIVFTGSRDDGDHLFVVGSDGTGRRQLTSGPGFDDALPAWSPGRQRIAFTSTRLSGTVLQKDIFVVDSEGRGLRPIIQTERDEERPAWAPDGRSIVFGRDSTGRGDSDLYVLTLATNRVRRLTATRSSEGAPSWSPDGKWIAYARDLEIWLIRPDGKKAHGLGKTGVGQDWAPDWAPDSQRIAYESTSRTSNSNPVTEVWVMGRDGKGKRRLTPYLPRRVAATSPAWSPRGAQIVFSRGGQLWTIRRDGSHARQLTRAPGYAFSPDW